MILDRLEMLAAISFIEPAIPKGAETGKNCLFVRVDGDKFIFTGGAQFVTKKVVIQRPNTVEESDLSGQVKPLPETFMIPRADLFAFAKMMQEHKADCKKLSKNDPSYLFVEMSDTEFISYDGKIVYEQPKFEFKELESVFKVYNEPVSEISMISADVIAAMSGFSKSKPVQITFTGPQSLIHLQQEDYEAIALPLTEVEDNKEQDHGEDQTTTVQ